MSPEIGLYREHPDHIDPLIVHPRIVATTQVVTRTVVRLDVPIKASEMHVFSESGARVSHTITEEEYYQTLTRDAGSAVADFVRELVIEAPNHDLRVEWMKAGPVLKHDLEVKGFLNFGSLHYTGYLHDRGYLFWRFKDYALPLEICRDYFDDVHRVLPHVAGHVISQGLKLEAEVLRVSPTGGWSK